MGTKENEQGVSFRDVAAALQDGTSRRGGYWCYSVSFDKPRDGAVRLCVVLERRESVVYADCKRHPSRVWRYWPNKDCTTFAGLLFSMFYELDRKLDEAETLAQGAMPF